MKKTSPLDQEPQQIYTPQCLVLVTQVCTCENCGQTYRSPNPQLLVESTNNHSYRRRLYKPGKGDTSKLYRRKMEINTKAFACEQCFVIDTGDYPRPRPQPRNLKKPHPETAVEAKAPIKPLALEEI